MTARWITTVEEFAALAPAWDRALTASGSENPFLLSEFVLTWAEAAMPEYGLRGLVCFENGDIVGGLPLCRSRRARGIWMLAMTYSYWTAPFYLGTAEAFAAACAGALEELEGWQFLRLASAPGPLWPEGNGGPWTRLPQMVKPTALGARICLAPGQDAASYLATCKTRHRYNVRRHLRLARAAGGIELRRETEPEALRTLIEFQLRHNGPRRHEVPGYELGERKAERFYRTLLARLSQAGRLDAMGLYIGGELVAVGFGVRFGPGFKWLLMSYDPRWRHLGPGQMLVYQVIDWCAWNGDPFIELFEQGSSEHKRCWCNRFDPLYWVRVFPASLAGRALHRLAEWMGP